MKQTSWEIYTCPDCGSRGETDAHATFCYCNGERKIRIKIKVRQRLGPERHL